MNKVVELVWATWYYLFAEVGSRWLFWKCVMHLNTYIKHTSLFNKRKSLLKVYVLSPLLHFTHPLFSNSHLNFRLTGLLSLNSPELTLSLWLHKWWFINFLKHAWITTLLPLSSLLALLLCPYLSSLSTFAWMAPSALQFHLIYYKLKEYFHEPLPGSFHKVKSPWFQCRGVE